MSELSRAAASLLRLKKSVVRVAQAFERVYVCMDVCMDVCMSFMYCVSEPSWRESS